MAISREQADIALANGQKVRLKDLSLRQQRLIRGKLPENFRTGSKSTVKLLKDVTSLDGIVQENRDLARDTIERRGGTIGDERKKELQKIRRQKRAKAQQENSIAASEEARQRRELQQTLGGLTATTQSGATNRIAPEEVVGIDEFGNPIIQRQQIPLPQTEQLDNIETTSGEGLRTGFIPTERGVSRQLPEDLTLDDLTRLAAERANRFITRPAISSGIIGGSAEQITEAGRDFIDQLLEKKEQTQRSIKEIGKRTKEATTNILSDLLKVDRSKVTPSKRLVEQKREESILKGLRKLGLDPSLSTIDELKGIAIEDPVTGKRIMFNEDGSIVEAI